VGKLRAEAAADMPDDQREPLRELYLRYGCCMAFIAVEKQSAVGIGSAFHVG
jgi:hypothetical protein